MKVGLRVGFCSSGAGGGRAAGRARLEVADVKPAEVDSWLRSRGCRDGAGWAGGGSMARGTDEGETRG